MTIQPYNNLFVFVLGRETKIALLELESVLANFGFDFSISNVSGNLVFINIKDGKKFHPKGLIESLGGTIKIFKILEKISKNVLESSIKNIILEDKAKQGGKLKFGLSNFFEPISRKDIQGLGIKIKMDLKSKMSIRYIENREGGDLQPVVSAKNKLDSKGIEFGLFNGVIARSETTKSSEGDPFGQSDTEYHPRLDRGSKNSSVDSRLRGNDNTLLLGKLIAVYDPVSWSKRDYGKPKSDKYSGMMPPKLARSLINITFGLANSKSQTLNSKQVLKSNDQNSKQFGELENSNLDIVSNLGFSASDLTPVVFDPFCGSGNILIEAIALGCSVVGSDISEKAVEDTRANLKWILNSKSQTSALASPRRDRPNSKQIQNNNDQNTKHQNGCHSELDSESIQMDPRVKPEDDKSTDQLINEFTIFQADATSEEMINKLNQSVIASGAKQSRDMIIVGEPYLGKPKKKKSKKKDMRAEVTELKKLYRGFLKNISTLSCHSTKLSSRAESRDPLKQKEISPLASLGRNDKNVEKESEIALKAICLVFPLFELENGEKYSLYDECIDEIKKLGYTPIRNLIYGRDYQVIKREIVFLKIQDTRDKDTNKKKYLN